MQLLAVGLNHTTAPVSLRERLAFAPDQLGEAVRAAQAWFGRSATRGDDEAAILSTCNRTEPTTRSTRAPTSWRTSTS
jgi:glutamyl-tRNA reductase